MLLQPAGLDRWDSYIQCCSCSIGWVKLQGGVQGLCVVLLALGMGKEGKVLNTAALLGLQLLIESRTALEETN